MGARGLLQILAATVSNLSQIKEHATALGGQFTALVQEGGPLASMLMMARALGLSIKAGGPSPPEFAIQRIEAAAPLLNALAKSLNIDRLSVAPPAWHAPLSGMRSALAQALEPEE